MLAEALLLNELFRFNYNRETGRMEAIEIFG
jgi:hypothetical protein